MGGKRSQAWGRKDGAMILDVIVTGTTVAVAYGAGFWLGKVDRRLAGAAEEPEPVELGKEGWQRNGSQGWEKQDSLKGHTKEDWQGNGSQGWEKQDSRRGRVKEERESRSYNGIQMNLWDRARKDQVQERLPNGAKRILLGRAIGSPVTGEVTYFSEGSSRGAMIRSSQGKLYAPASGKIVKLYPTGNRMRLRTEYGVELLIQAGIETGGLEGLHYRPRVVQNEIVTKGKLLLEYDPEAIRLEGYDPTVVMSVEDAQDYRDITVADMPQVKNGEDIMWVRK